MGNEAGGALSFQLHPSSLERTLKAHSRGAPSPHLAP